METSVARRKAVKFDVERIRTDFPVLNQKVNGSPLVYFDNAASAQKPNTVIERLNDFYSHEYSNIHRGVHYLSQHATDSYEDARTRAAGFINAADASEIIFTRGTTEAINLVASTYGRVHVSEGDEIIVTTMEHHSNIIPWQILAGEKKAHLKVAPVSEEGELLYEDFLDLLTPRTKLLAITHVSNSLGTINPLREIIHEAHQVGIPVLVDGAQAVPHVRVDVREMEADFYCFSGHKLFGPTGIGVLYGKKAILEEMPPYQSGGDMIKEVSFEKTIYADVPQRFEAGTQHIAGAIGLGAAIEYIEGVGLDAVEQYEHQLLSYATEKLSEIGGVRIIGTAKNKAAVLSLTIAGIHPYDVGTLLDQFGVAVRTGHHCTQPLMDRFCLPGTTRASLAFYNTTEEIDRFVSVLNKVINMLS